MKIIADTHTHTQPSGDAFSTIMENIAVAKEKGLKFICMTEHVNSVPRSVPEAFLKKLYLIPKHFQGIRLVRGVETNIINYDGLLDVSSDTLNSLEWVIASLHTEVIEPASKYEHTKCWEAIAENPLVDVIGHCGDPQYSFDIEPVVKRFAKFGKIVEINNHSFESRKGASEICEQVAKMCMKYSVPVVVGSDAHFAGSVGEFSLALNMLKKISFPEELILNASVERFDDYLKNKSVLS